MIIEKLDDLYQQRSCLAGSTIPARGYTVQKVSFEVLLDRDGRLTGIHDLRTGAGSAKRPRPMNLPGQARPTGPGINPRLFWDNAAYMLGHRGAKDNARRVAAAFVSFRRRHLELEETMADPAFSTLCRFLENWDPGRQTAAHARVLDDVSRNGFGVFRVDGMGGFLHERPFVEAWIRAQQATADSEQGECLVTGRTAPIAILHEPAIKGVAGAQPCGAKLVSFNCRSFCSYGKERGWNAPVSDEVVFRYATVLNELIADPKRRTALGDTTIVFWTQQPLPFESALSDFFSHGAPVPAVPSAGEESDMPVSILGLSPNTARLSVRFWHHASVRSVSDCLARYSDETGPFAPRVLIEQASRDRNASSPIMSGALLRSLFNGQPYPVVLAMETLARIREQHRLDEARLAFLRAFTQRNLGRKTTGRLDEGNREPSYLLGRLYAVHEKTQADAGANVAVESLAGRYAAASCRPASVFPDVLRRLAGDLKSLRPAMRSMRERELAGIWPGGCPFPSRLDLEGQIFFALGYCHQTTYFFTTRKQSTHVSHTHESPI